MKNLLQQIKYPFLLLIILLSGFALAEATVSSKALQFSDTISKKLTAKVDDIFVSAPKLLATYNKTRSTELSEMLHLPEYQDLLNSQELNKLNHSPEMQEVLKEVINEMNTNIAGINNDIEVIALQLNKYKKELQTSDKTTLTVSELKRRIYAQEGAVKVLQAGIGNVILALNQQQQLYFTNPKLANNVDDFTPIQQADTLTTSALLTDLVNLDQALDTRMTSVILHDYPVALADQITHSVLWIKGLKSSASQRQYQLVQGYRLDQQGMVIGLDSRDNSIGLLNSVDTTLGMAYAFGYDRIKGGAIEEKINNHIMTIYGFYKLTPNTIINAQGKYGKSYINKSRQNMNLSKDISYAKTDGNLYGGKLELCYDFITSGKVNIIPSIGIIYDELEIKKYREQGSGFNRGVEARKIKKTTSLFGIKVSKAVELGAYTVMPEIHVKYIQNRFNANSNDTAISILDGTESLITPSGDIQKRLYKIGGSLQIIRSKPINIAISYDFGKSKKYHSHAGHISALLSF